MKFINKYKKSIFCFLLAVLIALLVSCNKNNAPANESTPIADSIVGEGEAEFIFEAVFSDGTAKAYRVKTNQAMLDEALVEAGLIGGDKTQFGLTVTTVCGVVHDFEKGDKIYWSFYIDDEYAPTGVSSTEVTEGAKYSFKAEKASW